MSADIKASIDAIFVRARLISESLSSAAARPAPPNHHQQLQVNTETASNMAAAIDDPVKPETMLVEIQYMVVHKQESDGRELVKYESSHSVQFLVRSSSGVSNWRSPPTAALAGYFAIAHGIARRRAEHTFLDMGMHGVVLPIPTEYSPPSEVTGVAEASAAS